MVPGSIPVDHYYEVATPVPGRSTRCTILLLETVLFSGGLVAVVCTLLDFK